MKCSNCGTFYDEGEAVCPGCGAPLDTNSQTPEAPAAPSPVTPDFTQPTYQQQPVYQQPAYQQQQPFYGQPGVPPNMAPDPLLAKKDASMKQEAIIQLILFCVLGINVIGIALSAMSLGKANSIIQKMSVMNLAGAQADRINCKKQLKIGWIWMGISTVLVFLRIVLRFS